MARDRATCVARQAAVSRHGVGRAAGALACGTGGQQAQAALVWGAGALGCWAGRWARRACGRRGAAADEQAGAQAQGRGARGSRQLGQFWCSCTWLGFQPGFSTRYFS